METLKELFDNWNKLNTQANESMGEFDFSKIKEIRKKQTSIENKIFEMLKKTAPKHILELLPEDCGQMEMGFNNEKELFYFVMVDDEASTDDELKLQALSLDTSGNIELIKNFEIKDE
ncbi:MAG: hypothetical protein ACFFKA_02135 [Candidatus Thorarchaeota archaeon]